MTSPTSFARNARLLLSLGAVALTGSLVAAPTLVARAEPVPATSEVSGSVASTASREQVLREYQDVWKPLAAQDAPYVGEHTTCTNPDLTPAQRSSILRGLNYLRGLAGIPAVSTVERGDFLAHEAAFVLAVNARMSHYIGPEEECYNEDAAAGARQSLLTVKMDRSTSASQLPLQFFDDVGVPDLGHRHFLLSPALSTVGIGHVGNTQAIYIGEYSAGRWPTGRGGIAWPAQGYFPEQLIPAQDMAWSFHRLNYEYVGFKNPKVSISNLTYPERAVTVEMASRDREMVSFKPRGLVLPSTNDGRDVTYEITVSGVVDRKGNPLPDFVYEVTLIDGDAPAPAPVQWSQQPTITGEAQAGKTLVASPGTFAPTADDAQVSYRWLRGSTTVGSGSTYTLTGADVGHALTLEVAVSHADFAGQTTVSTATVTSDPNATPPSAITRPTIQGAVVVGQTLTTTPGEWNQPVAGARYQWLANDLPVAGATSSTYTVPAADAGKRLSVAVTVSNAGGATNTANSDRTAPVERAAAPRVVSAVRVQGNPRVGGALRAAGFEFEQPSGAASAGKTTFQWFVDNKPLAASVGGRTAKIKVHKSYAGKRIHVTVSYVVPGYQSATTSAKPVRIARN